MQKNILIFMASPRSRGNTNALCNRFAEGAREAGHNVTQINFSNIKLSPCLGCDYCGSHNGKCCQPDDMNAILDIFNSCDVIVLASPLYYYTINAQLKIFIDRLYAAGLHNNFKYDKKESVLIMTCGESSDDIFDQPVGYYHLLLSKMFPWKNRGEILASGFSKNPSIADRSELYDAYELGRTI